MTGLTVSPARSLAIELGARLSSVHQGFEPIRRDRRQLVAHLRQMINSDVMSNIKNKPRITQKSRKRVSRPIISMKSRESPLLEDITR